MSDQHPGAHPPGPDPAGDPQAGPSGPSYPGQSYPSQGYAGPQHPGQSYAGPQQPGQAYGSQPTPAYFQPPLAIPPLPRTAYAPWGRRVLASLIDFAPTIVGFIVYLVSYVQLMTTAFSDLDGSGGSPSITTFLNPGVVIGIGIMFAAVVWNLYNRWIKGGKTGQSLGKRVARLTLLSEQTGAPVGAGMAFLRDVVHALDGAAFWVGYLWPLWDEKRQTFADKLMQTVVLPAPDAPQSLPPSALQSNAFQSSASQQSAPQQSAPQPTAPQPNGRP